MKIKMKKNYNYNNLTNKYTFLFEKASLTLRKEMFREECWDATNERPVAECWTETGDIKDECWSSGPGSSSSMDGGAGPGIVVPETETPSTVTHKDAATELLHHLRQAEQAATNLKESGDKITDPDLQTRIENILHALYELQRETEVIEGELDSF